MLPDTTLIFVGCWINFLGHVVATTYSCDVFQKDFYTAEYDRKCYVHVKSFKTFEDSKDRCVSSGGRLPKLKDADQYDYVMNGRNYIYRGQKRDTDTMTVWIDAKKVNGKLQWTNGELMTYSKPFHNGDQGLEETHCILTSRHVWDSADCKEEHAGYVCEHDKDPTTPNPQQTSTYTTDFTTGTDVVPSSAKPTVIVTVSPSTAVSIQAKRVTVQREMNFRVVRHAGGVLNPKLKLKPDNEFCTASLTECTERCLSFTKDCQLFNFLWENGECLVYGNKQAAMETGANSVIGWKLYERYNAATNAQ